MLLEHSILSYSRDLGTGGTLVHCNNFGDWGGDDDMGEKDDCDNQSLFLTPPEELP